MWNEPRLYGFYPEEELFPESGDYRLPSGFLPSAESRPLTPEDVAALSRFAEGKEGRACVSFESDEYDPCVILLKRTEEGVFVLRLRSLSSVDDEEQLGKLTDLLISIASARRSAREEAAPFFLPDEARTAFRRFFGDGEESVTAREVSLFCSTVATLQCVLPVFDGAIDNDTPLVPKRETCRFWEYYLTCLSAMLRAAKKSENRVLRISSAFNPAEGRFFFSFSASGEKSAARSLARISERLRALFPAPASGSLAIDSGWRVETSYRAGTVVLTLCTPQSDNTAMHTPLPVTLFPAYLSSLPAFAEAIGDLL